MKRTVVNCFTLVAVLIVCLPSVSKAQLTDSPWPIFRHDAQHTGMSEYSGPSVPRQSWRHHIGDGPRIDSSPALGSDGSVYYGCSGIETLNSNGTFKWGVGIGELATSSPALGNDGKAYAGADDGIVYAWNSNGSLAWTFSTGDSVRSSPVLGEGEMVYVGSEDNMLYSFNSAGELAWSYRTGDNLDSSPALGNDERVYIGSEDNMLYSLSSAGELAWSHKTGDYVDSSPAVGSNSRVYVGSDDNNLYVFNSNGTFVWSYATEGIVESSPALGSDGRLYVGSWDGRLYSFSSTGQLAWTYLICGSITSSPALGNDGIVYIGSINNCLAAVNSNGSLAWTFSTGDDVLSSPVLGSDGRVYVGSGYWGIMGDYDGAIYCIEQGLNPTITPTPTIAPTPTITPTPNQGACYVSETTGSDVTGNGSKDNPWKTIGHAISMAAGSEASPVEIRIAKGSYTENVVMDEYESISGGYDPSDWTRNIPTNETIIDGGGGTDASTVIAASHATVDGFTITGGGSGFLSGGIFCDMADTGISRCTFTGNGYGITVYVGDYPTLCPTVNNCMFRSNTIGAIYNYSESGPDFLTISNCTFQNNGAGIAGLWTGLVSNCIFLQNARNAVEGAGFTIADSVIIGNGGYALYAEHVSLKRCIVNNNVWGMLFVSEQRSYIEQCVITGNGTGLSTGPLSYLYVDNCILANNGDIGINAGFMAMTHVRNSTVVGHSSYGIKGTVSDPSTVTDCIIWNNGDDLFNATATYSDISDGDAGTGNISIEPLFADPDNGNYHLHPGSPCIDAGTNTGLTEDFEGDSRPLDGNGNGTAEYDIGADEYNPSITPTPTDIPTDTPTRTPTETPTEAPTPHPLEIWLPWIPESTFTLGIRLNENITKPFDFYLLAETPAGVYTIYMNGNIKKGITPIYKNVPKLNAGFSTIVRPTIKIPSSMKGKTITFYAAVIEAGKKPRIKSLSELTPDTLYVIMMDKSTVMVGQ